MTALDNVSKVQFYHGTAHEFAPGDMVDPQHAPCADDDEGNKYSYFTPSSDLAGKYGGHVYRVQPTGDYESPESYGGRWAPLLKGEFRSAHPLRVTGEA